MIALYDTLTRWDPATQKYVMRTAESVTANADNTEWTVKIKPNIKFTDGTDYDAEAVKFGINRHRVGITTVKVPVGIGDSCKDYFACPCNNVSSSAYVAVDRRHSGRRQVDTQVPAQRAVLRLPVHLVGRGGNDPFQGRFDQGVHRSR